jgi:hypothetical protein
MPVSKKDLALLRARDPHCVHCGATDDLIPHHRINRGMGGSKSLLLNSLSNLLLVCSFYNGEMESTSAVANAARGWGHKLPSWGDTSQPVFDCTQFRWWVLTADGAKVEFHIG